MRNILPEDKIQKALREEASNFFKSLTWGKRKEYGKPPLISSGILILYESDIQIINSDTARVRNHMSKLKIVGENKTGRMC